MKVAGLAGALAALAAARVHPVEEAEKWLKYFEFADWMHWYGYTWEPYDVLTDDGYTLTTFRVTGNKWYPDRHPNPEYNPVMLMHGSTADACSWLAWAHGYKPLPLRLFDDGFDVWMASNRGTKYCQKHETYTVEDEEFWDWSWMEMGLYDDTSNLSMIKNETGKDKVSYVAVSQGTVQMFYALSTIEESFMADNVFTFLALSPCTVCAREGPPELFYEGVFEWPSMGIFALNGPNWEQDAALICETQGQIQCDLANGYFGTEPQSVKNQILWSQNEVLNVFQEYVDNDTFRNGHTAGKLIDLASMDKVPITMWTGHLDDECPNKWAFETASVSPSVQHVFNVPWAGHGQGGGAGGIRSIVYYPDFKQRLITPEIGAGVETLTFE